MESLTLHRHVIGGDSPSYRPTGGCLAADHKLDHLHLEHNISSVDGFDCLFDDISPTLTSLRLEFDSRAVLSSMQHLPACIGKVETVTPMLVRRTQPLIRRMTSVRRLTVGEGCVVDWPTAIQPLAHVTEISIVSSGFDSAALM